MKSPLDRNSIIMPSPLVKSLRRAKRPLLLSAALTITLVLLAASLFFCPSTHAKDSRMAKKMTVLLWPDGAPGAMGDAVADKPDLTLYGPEGDGPFSCVVICPGGGYGAKAAHEGEPIALWLNSIGIAGAVVQYRVSPYRYPVPADDARRVACAPSRQGLRPLHRSGRRPGR